MVDFAEIEKTALNDVEKYSKIYEEAALFNTEKVMKAFRNHMVSDYYFRLLFKTYNRLCLFRCWAREP